MAEIEVVSAHRGSGGLLRTVVFWVASSISIIVAISLIFSLSHLYRELDGARAQIAAAQKARLLAEGNAAQTKKDLSVSQAQVAHLCAEATKQNSMLTDQKYAKAVNDLDTEYLMQARLVQSLACTL